MEGSQDVRRGVVLSHVLTSAVCYIVVIQELSAIEGKARITTSHKAWENPCRPLSYARRCALSGGGAHRAAVSGA